MKGAGPTQSSGAQAPPLLPDLRPSDPVSRVPRLGPARAAKHEKDGITTVGDLLLALPFR